MSMRIAVGVDANVVELERAIKSSSATVLCLGSLVVGRNVAPLLVDHWLDGEFVGGNSGRKAAKIEDLEQRERARSA